MAPHWGHLRGPIFSRLHHPDKQLSWLLFMLLWFKKKRKKKEKKKIKHLEKSCLRQERIRPGSIQEFITAGSSRWLGLGASTPVVSAHFLHYTQLMIPTQRIMSTAIK